MRIKVTKECKQGRFPWSKSEVVEVSDIVAAFRYCYEEQLKYTSEDKIRAWTMGYSWTEGYFGNQYLTTFEVLSD